MSRRARKRTTFAAVAVFAALLLPTSQAAAGGAQVATAGDGPVATKSGAIINWRSGFKLKIAKRVQPLAVCSVDCTVSGVGKLKGMGGKVSFADSGTFPAGQLFGLYVKLPKRVRSLIKQHPGRFTSHRDADRDRRHHRRRGRISRTFKFKRGK